MCLFAFVMLLARWFSSTHAQHKRFPQQENYITSLLIVAKVICGSGTKQTGHSSVGGWGFHRSGCPGPCIGLRGRRRRYLMLWRHYLCRAHRPASPTRADRPLGPSAQAHSIYPLLPRAYCRAKNERCWPHWPLASSLQIFEYQGEGAPPKKVPRRPGRFSGRFLSIQKSIL